MEKVFVNEIAEPMASEKLARKLLRLTKRCDFSL
jgi:hypothetical protein